MKECALLYKEFYEIFCEVKRLYADNVKHIVFKTIKNLNEYTTLINKSRLFAKYYRESDNFAVILNGCMLLVTSTKPLVLIPAWDQMFTPWTNVETIVFETVTFRGGLSNTFYHCNAKTIDFTDSIFEAGDSLDDDGIIFYSTFGQCAAEEINFSNVVFKDSVTKMSCAFYSCKNLKRLDLSKFDMDDLVHMEQSFAFCPNLEEIKFNKHTYNHTLKSMYATFSGCEKLKEIDLSGFLGYVGPDAQTVRRSMRVSYGDAFFSEDESITIIFGETFKNCRALEKVHFDDRGYKVDAEKILATEMFANCESLVDVNIEKVHRIEAAESMFSGCEKLKSIKLNIDMSVIKSVRYMFCDCRELEKIDVNISDTSDICIDGTRMLEGCYKIDEQSYKLCKEYFNVYKD